MATDLLNFKLLSDDSTVSIDPKNIVALLPSKQGEAYSVIVTRDGNYEIKTPFKELKKLTSDPVESYIIVEGYGFGSLAPKVNEKMAEGYEPTGGPVIIQNEGTLYPMSFCYQAMVLKRS